MKKSVKGFEAYIVKTIERFIPILLLQKYTFEVEPIEDAGAQPHYECSFNYPYLKVSIRYSKRSFEDWRKGVDQTYHIIHELCHVITDPFYAKAVSLYKSKGEIEDEREALTDHICAIVFKQTI